MLHDHPTRTLLIALAALLFAAILVYLFAMNYVSLRRVAAPATTTNVPTPRDYVTAQKGFQYLVSYTDNGFAPPALSVGENETVRFTNNSNNPLRLSLENAQVTSLNHGEYYEYTFANAGTFAYSDSISEMTVTVK